jgi:predicted DNA-binding WGR domain protein
MFVVPGLLDDWSLVREWGRAGSPGSVRKDWFGSKEDAVIAGEKIRVFKEKKGYQSIL